MSLSKEAFDIDCEEVCKKVEKFIQDYVAGSHTKGLVIGLSGGIDSAVSAALAVRALGNDKVLGLILPNEKLAQHYEDDARVLAEQLGVEKEKITTDSDFVNDLGADSLDTVELVMELEEEFDINIPDEAAEKIQTVVEAIAHIEKSAG